MIFQTPIPLRGALLSRDGELKTLVAGLWPENEMHWSFYSSGAEAVENILEELPDIFIADMDMPDLSGAEVITMVKGENVYRKIPALLCLDKRKFSPDVDWDSVPADDFILLPAGPEELKSRIGLALARSYRSMDANPLTRLPGNTSIINFVQSSIDRREDFALGYCDLDFFKSFNDKYGFARGDEVLMMTARILLNMVRSHAPGKSFVGHVGGDDFVFAVRPDLAVLVCENVIKSFDGIIPQFYDAEDRQRGSIVSSDRQGVIRNFPLMAISIAVVLNEGGSLTHFGQVAQIVSKLKSKAKESPYSNYIVDRRKYSQT